MTTHQTSQWITPASYAATHCRVCKNGWTLISTKGTVLTRCMLAFGAPVLADLASCDRFEKRAETPAD